MKIVVYDEKSQSHKFLRGNTNQNQFWVSNRNDADDYTEEEYKKIQNDYWKKRLNKHFTELGYIK
jgi:hypothetical protein